MTCFLGEYSWERDSFTLEVNRIRANHETHELQKFNDAFHPSDSGHLLTVVVLYPQLIFFS